jgi:hypothetical protein
MTVSDIDPFSDAAFTGRLQKLVSLLGSEQPGEAEAARRKIGEHLAHHRLSFTDLSQHVQASQPARGPSFSQGARELSLERQLAIARAAKDEAAHEADAALHRVRALEIELQQLTFEIGRSLNSQAKVRVGAAIACIVAAACLILVVIPRGKMVDGVSPPVTRTGTVTLQQAAPEGDPATHLGPGELLGHAAVQDLAIRLSPNDQATIRAFLNYGEPIVIQHQIRLGAQTWLLVRSATGIGWVRSGDVLR